MLEVEKVNFQIQSLELTESSFKHPVKKAISDKEVFRFNLNLEHLIDSGQETLIVKIQVDILAESSEEIVGVIKSNVVFKILNLFNYFKDNKPGLPDILITTLNSISISTTRGMMFSAFRGTFLHNATLPLIDPTFKSDNRSNNINS